MSVIEGKFGKKEEDPAPTAQEALETFLEYITIPALEAEHSAVDAVAIQLDDDGVSLGSNCRNPADIVMLLELAKLSLLEQFMGSEFAGGPDGTVH